MYHACIGVNLKRKFLSLYTEFKMKAIVNEPEEQNKPNKDYFIFNLKD